MGAFRRGAKPAASDDHLFAGPAGPLWIDEKIWVARLFASVLEHGLTSSLQVTVLTLLEPIGPIMRFLPSMNSEVVRSIHEQQKIPGRRYVGIPAAP